MTDFIAFARERGVVIESLPAPGRWIRLPTEDHPRKRNGAVKYMGTHGFVQNHATMNGVEVWKADENATVSEVDHAAVARSIAAQRIRTMHAQQRAAEKAKWIIGESVNASHAYLASKGFPEHQTLVWARGELKLMVVPMRVAGVLVGCQLISELGEKKFLTGQRTRDAVFIMGDGPAIILCEGYATALSAHAAMHALKRRCGVVVCFSAFNLAAVAKFGWSRPLVLADHDKPTQNAPEAGGMGRKVAIDSGHPYWISDTEGEDFNDYHQRVGLFKASQALREALK